MTDIDCPALVQDFKAEERLVYMKDINFDRDGNPIILVVTSRTHKPGPEGQPCIIFATLHQPANVRRDGASSDATSLQRLCSFATLRPGPMAG